MDQTRFEVGQEVNLTIDGYSSEGDGVGRSGGAVFFVSGAVRGETVRARVSAARKNLYFAEISVVLTAAPARESPPCPHYGECGGCRLQHLSYAEQLWMKETRVRDAAERIGGLAGAAVRPILGAPAPWRYRNKLVFTAGRKEGRPILGFLRHASHEVVEITDCLLAEESMTRIAQTAFQLSLTHGDAAVTRVTVRKSRSLGEAMAVIETDGAELARGEELARALVAKEATVVSVVNVIRATPGGGPDRQIVLYGKETIEENLAGIVFSIAAETFFQINSRQAEAFYSQAAALIPAKQDARVLDAYCGLGGFALFMAGRADAVLGIERDVTAVREAGENARRNGLTNVRFIARDLESRTATLRKELRNFTDLVIDPPRRGLAGSFRETCAALGFKRILYASCDPATLARDARYFTGQGYLVKEIIPFDMFPHTPHVECLARLER